MVDLFFTRNTNNNYLEQSEETLRTYNSKATCFSAKNKMCVHM